MTKIFLASTQFGAMSLCAGIDEGIFGGRDERRILLTWNHAVAAELAPALEQLPGFAPLRDRFDDVVSLNELIAPLHPAGWKPPTGELPMLDRLLRHRLGVEEPISELVLESLGASTSATVASILRGCPVTVYSDGLMTYGPTRATPPPDLTGRIDRLVHLDLVPGLSPLLLAEFGVKSEALGARAFTDVLDLLPPATSEIPTGAAMIVGQYLAALEILTVEEEAGLHESMLRALVADGHRQVVFKAHPAAGRAQRRHLEAVADTLDVTLTTAHEGDPVETLLRDHRPALVVGCFSTALAVASRFYDIPVATMGGELVLERLTPFRNSNRIPATIADAAFPRLHADGTITDAPRSDVTALVEAVGYCMQPAIHPELHEAAASYIATHGSARYFKQRPLQAVGIVERSLRGRLRHRAAELAGGNARADLAAVALLRAKQTAARVRAKP